MLLSSSTVFRRLSSTYRLLLLLLARFTVGEEENDKRPLEEEKEMVIGEPAACRQPMSLMANTTLTLGTVWRFTSRFNLLYRNELSFFTLHLLHLLISSRGGPVSRNSNDCLC